MKIHTYKLFILFIFISGISYSQSNSQKIISKGHQLYKQIKLNNNKAIKDTNGISPLHRGDRAADRIYYEFDRTCDPKTRKVPEGIHKKERIFVSSKKSLQSDGKKLKITRGTWEKRGPYNIGGRTRALAIDITNEDVILAGGVSGGLWRSEDGGENWIKVTRTFQNPSITTIAQDLRPGFQHIWYYGGGERIGNSAGYNSAGIYTGDGIYKSQDGGRTWELLSNTSDNNVNTISSFDNINKIAVHPITGDIYVATFDGIHRSQNGGQSFELVLTAGRDFNAEISIAKTGRIYAAISINRSTGTTNDNVGIYTSINGTHWNNISSEEGVFNEDNIGRSIIAIHPFNDKEIFVLSNNLKSLPFLYHYQGQNINQKWLDLTSKTPSIRFNRPVGGLNLQTGYNMVLEIHPQNPNFIIFGGTNLFRTTDGFATDVVDTPNHWIGGYSPINDVSLYPDQHPDMHAVIFYPSNPNKVLNANDGGIFRTEDITANNSFLEPVDWVSLNNGYNTTQPYTIALDPKTNSKDLLAGFQDNGTWYTNTTDLKTPWSEELGGDGSYNAIADQGRTRYSSSQFANIVRINYDESGNPVSFASVAPPGAYSFINPFILDRNNDNVMYLPAGNQLFRNSDLDSIPTVTDINELGNVPTNNWSLIASVESISENNRELNVITALDVSKYPETDKLYFGTGQGQLFRMDFANLDSSKPVDIFSNKGLPTRGFVSSIQVDPNNSNRVIVSFSNYNIPSVFFTNDGGETWLDISGNLEENKDGTGNGPSVRWVTFLGNHDGILAGTSTGLYYTKKPAGKFTVWRQENQQIGNGVVMQARTREDGFTAIAVHGNGVFSNQFRVKEPFGPMTLVVNEEIEDRSFFTDETPDILKIDVRNVFKDNRPGVIRFPRISIENSNPDLIDVQLRSNVVLLIRFKKANLDIPEIEKEGEVNIRLIGQLGEEQKTATEFTINIFEKPIFTQFDQTKELAFRLAIPSTEVPEDELSGMREFSEVADHITIPEGETWSINRITLPGRNIFADESLPLTDTGVLRVYKDKNGTPGELIAEKSNTLRSNPFIVGVYDLTLPEPLELGSGKYWLVWVRIDSVLLLNNTIIGHQIFPSDDSQFDAIGENAHFRGTVEPNNEPDTSDTWIPFNDYFGSNDDEKVKLIFSLFGIINGQNKLNNNDLLQEAVSLHPNPVKESFEISLKSNNLGKHKTTKAFITIADISGREVYKTTTLESNLSVNTSTWLSGVYILKVTNANNLEYTTKIIKL